MVDCVASLGCMPFEMDDWKVDVAMSGSQKGLMTPPGLAFVAANDRALAAHEKADLRTRYWDWTFRMGQVHYQKYGGTPPQHLLFALRKALDLLLAEGLPHAARRHALLSEATRRAVARWAEGGALAFNVTEPAERGNSVTTVLTPGLDPKPLLDYCRFQCGVVVGVGIGELSGKAFRIAHMGHVNAPMVIGTLAAVAPVAGLTWASLGVTMTSIGRSWSPRPSPWQKLRPKGARPRALRPATAAWGLAWRCAQPSAWTSRAR